MAFTSGFFNSLRGDRKYNAEQMSEIFDGILADGIIPTQGQIFAVNTAENGMQITVGTGRAWFDHTWSKNDSVMVLTVEDSDVSRGRYDTVVIEVNHNVEVRANSIKIIKGIASQNPEHPMLLNTNEIKQYPLAHIYVGPGVEEIKASNIENMVGRSPTVFATGILETAPLDDLWNQWKGEWEEWFARIKLQLSGDIVTNLQYQIDQLREAVKYLNDTFEVVEVVHNDVITTSGTWQNTTGKKINVTVKCFGGGASGSNSGGGGGHIGTWAGEILANQNVNVTIGQGGTNGAGGTTSFGTYCSANGGSGMNGGTGGGASGSSRVFVGSNTPASSGGTGSYGGGGGAGGGYPKAVLRNGAAPDSGGIGGSGGSGGTYGGGGGGGGGGGAGYWAVESKSATGTYTGKNGGGGGTKGGYGGNGGTGGTGGSTIISSREIESRTYYHTYSFSSGSSGSSGSAGYNTNGQDLEFTGSGSGGSGRSGAGASSSSITAGGGGGGGGGGGYGGVGGTGGSGGAGSTRQYEYAGSYYFNTGSGGGGGGGGGYGASGGTGGTGAEDVSGGGGGGGGYGHAGGNASGQYGGGGGGYGPNNYGGGGNGTGTTNGNSGVCVVTYITREVIPSN